MTGSLRIRAAEIADQPAIWQIIGPVIRSGETYPLPRDWPEDKAIAYWFSPQHSVFVAEADGALLGSYYLKANNQGGGAHVANCGYMVAAHARGKGVARRMCTHSLDAAKQAGFTAMQFNFVVASNEGAVHLWTDMGFETVGRLPDAFRHPTQGLVDALVMFRTL